MAGDNVTGPISLLAPPEIEIMDYLVFNVRQRLDPHNCETGNWSITAFQLEKSNTKMNSGTWDPGAGNLGAGNLGPWSWDLRAAGC